MPRDDHLLWLQARGGQNTWLRPAEALRESRHLDSRLSLDIVLCLWVGHITSLDLNFICYQVGLITPALLISLQLHEEQ